MGWDELIAALGKCRGLLTVGKACSIKVALTLTLAGGSSIPITADLSLAPLKQTGASAARVTKTTTVTNASSAGTPKTQAQGYAVVVKEVN